MGGDATRSASQDADRTTAQDAMANYAHDMTQDMQAAPGQATAAGPLPAFLRPLDSLAATLEGTLPTGSRLVVLWDDPLLGRGRSSLRNLPAPLLERGLSTLQGDASTVADDALSIDDAWDEDGARIALAVSLRQPLTDTSRGGWLALSRRMVATTLAQARAQARIESLQKAQRLQRALYEIADLAGSRLEMDEMLSRIHAVVGALMSAENFYIVLCDEALQNMRFLYFADTMDTFVADPERVYGLDEMPNSLTVALLRHGHALHGPSKLVREQLQVVRDPEHGPDSADWLGVPMLRDGAISGAIVVQSYERPDCYRDEERALLEYVAQHILTALDRKHAQVELERRVIERTRELQQANVELQAEIVERQRAEALQRTLFRITERSMAGDTMQQFYADLHAIIGELLYARNFYVAMLDDDGECIEFPYSVDERDRIRSPRRLALGLTEYVLQSGRSLRVDREGIARLEAAGELRTQGSLAHHWLGVPLVQQGATIGVIAVQSYTPEIEFDQTDEDLLTYVAHHISAALERRRAQESLRAAHLQLETRVEARTRELAATNRELRAQIAERERIERQLSHQARHDDLTGLPNRAHLLERMDAAIARIPASRGLAVLFMDLDRFKLVNDSVGHASGDEMLVEAGRRLSALIGDGQLAARLGGDEFAILVEGEADDASLESLADRVLDALAEPMWIAGRELFPSASIGIARWHPRYRRGEELLRDADAAMYRAKAAGRDCSMLFDEAMREEATRLLDLESDLRRAIKRDDFEPWFQPIVRLSDGAVVGHEALLRWNHESRGLLTPAEFIGVGEDSGLIEEVDWLLYRRVLQWTRTHPAGYVSINVSPRHLRSEDFARRLLQLAEETGADPRRLRIEITEIALLDDSPRALRMLNHLRGRGISAQLDDFGTGFSALSYLHRFPIQAIKIDRSFIAGLTGATRIESLALVRAILALAGTLGIDSIGEGVETTTQSDLLLGLGCQYGQGYLFGRPEPAAPAADAGDRVVQFPHPANRQG
jgi:diguanylate cyclase (GGDEF)-like protein